MVASCCVLSLALGLAALPPGAPTSDQIGHLINQLGSPQFKEREAATLALDTIGPPALDALQKAARGPDPEVRCRAERLAQQIHKRAEAAQLLRAKRVHLVYNDTPVAEAVEDFAQKTGFPLHLGTRASLVGRTVTLDTGEVSFWEALDQLCRKAGLLEQTPIGTPQQVNVTRTWRQGRAVGVQAVMVTSSYGGETTNWDGRITLVDGKPTKLPTYVAGAVRFRARSGEGTAWAQLLPAGSTQFLLEVTPEPKMGWQHILDLRIDQAVDERGRRLELADDVVEQFRVPGQGNMAILAHNDMGRARSDSREVPIQLKQLNPPSRHLREIKGVLTADVLTPLEPVITVDDVLHASGKSFKSSSGEALKVVEGTRQSDGGFQVTVQVEEPVDSFLGGLAMNGRLGPRGRIVLANGMAIRPGRGVMFRPGQMLPSTGRDEWSLVDSQGKRVAITTTAYNVHLTGNSVIQEYRLQYHTSEASLPLKLVYSNRRDVMLEVPFVLKDVPLGAQAAKR
jgi:hypothetical protein